MSERERFEAVAEEIIGKLDTYARSVDAREYGLPRFAYHGKSMSNIVCAALARSGQAASGSIQGARSDDQNGAGQPEAPTAAALVRDAERYRFLRDNDKRHFWPPVHGSMWVVVYHQPPGLHVMPETRGAGYGADLDVAIDAAIAVARSGAGSEEAQPDRAEGA